MKKYAQNHIHIRNKKRFHRCSDYSGSRHPIRNQCAPKSLGGSPSLQSNNNLADIVSPGEVSMLIRRPDRFLNVISRARRCLSVCCRWSRTPRRRILLTHGGVILYLSGSKRIESMVWWVTNAQSIKYTA